MFFSPAPALGLADHGGDWRLEYGGRQSTTRSPATGSANWRKIKWKSGRGRRQASKGEKAGAGRCWDRESRCREMLGQIWSAPVARVY